jgi:hypothetical protein
MSGARVWSSGALALLAWAPAFADETPPPRLAFDLSSTLDHATNPDLVTQGQPANEARLGFGISAASDTPDQKFRLHLGGVWTNGAGLGNTGSGNPGLGDPGLSLSWTKTGAHAALGVSLQSQESAVDQSNPQTLPDGTLNYGDLVATTGRLRASDASVSASFGTDRPLGLDLSAQAAVRDYAQTTDASLADIRQSSLRATGHLRDGGGGDLALSLGQSQSQTADSLDSHSRNHDVTLSYSRPLDGATKLSASLGQTSAQTQRAGVVTQSSAGLTGSLGLVRDLAAGQVSLGLDISRDALGARQALRLGRSLKTATGTFAGELGWSMRDGTAAAAVGQLSWAQNLPLDSLALSVSRQVVLNSDDLDTVQTSAKADWSHKLGQSASLGLSYALGAVMGLDAAVDGATRQSLTVTYSQNLTQDWALNTGVTLRHLDRDSTGRADDTAVFVTIGRSFVLLP